MMILITKKKLELVWETCQKTIKIFGESCSEEFLGCILEAKAKGVDDLGFRSGGAVFIPISAAYAFVYQKSGSLTIDSLQKLDKDTEVGMKKWRKLPDSKKFQVVRDAISNPTEYYKSLSRTNFHKFMLVLAY